MPCPFPRFLVLVVSAALPFPLKPRLPTVHRLAHRRSAVLLAPPPLSSSPWLWCALLRPASHPNPGSAPSLTQGPSFSCTWDPPNVTLLSSTGAAHTTGGSLSHQASEEGRLLRCLPRQAWGQWADALRRGGSEVCTALRSLQRTVKHSVDRSEGRSVTERLGDLGRAPALGPTR